MLFLMDLPKPVHGMSTINQSVIDSCIRSGINADIINTAPSYAARWFGHRRWQLFKFIHTIICYWRLLVYLARTRNPVVYRSIYGGSGLWYDIVYVALCRVFRVKLYIHHHSFNYINSHHTAFNILQRLAGKKAIHIVLGADMAQLIGQRYGIAPQQLRVLSNLAFFSLPNDQLTTPAGGPFVLGHLANLCFEKGLGTFIEICYRLHQHRIPFDAYLAGPIASPEVKDAIDKVTQELRNVYYLGPVYDDEKFLFYQKLDAFIFPTRYVNEAEPLVLYEAAVHGALVVGTQRGCMKQVIDNLGGYSIPETPDLTDAIAGFLIDAQEQNVFDLSNRRSRAERFTQARDRSKAVLQQLLEELNSNHVPET